MLQRIAASLACALAAAALIALAALAAPARAQAPLMDALFSDHVVLQRDRPIPIWGRAAAGEEITIVAADGNAALAVTIDIGNRDDVHPTNKQEVGRRLARAARHPVFGEKISASGVQPLSAVRAGSEVQVTFGDLDGSLVVHNSRDPSAFELCGAASGSCRYVRAQLGRDASVLLDAREVEAATRVRFCWADSPLCNLYDTAGLPVGPFEIEIKQS